MAAHLDAAIVGVPEAVEAKAAIATPGMMTSGPGRLQFTHPRAGEGEDDGH